MAIVSAEELAWALDTHVDFARAVLERVRAMQHRAPYIPPLPVEELTERANREAARVLNAQKHPSLPVPVPGFLHRHTERNT